MLVLKSQGCRSVVYILHIGHRLGVTPLSILFRPPPSDQRANRRPSRWPRRIVIDLCSDRSAQLRLGMRGRVGPRAQASLGLRVRAFKVCHPGASTCITCNLLSTIINAAGIGLTRRHGNMSEPSVRGRQSKAAAAKHQAARKKRKNAKSNASKLRAKHAKKALDQYHATLPKVSEVSDTMSPRAR